MTPSKGSRSLNHDGGPSANLDGVIPSGAVFQAERGISRGADMLHARSLDPLEKTRVFGMTPSKDCSPFNRPARL